MVAAVLAVYANALGGAFLWDDLHLVVGNPLIKHWQAWPRLFGSDLFPPPIASGYYRPLQALSYGLDYRLWGLVPFGFHLTNVLLHAATAVLLFRVAVALLGATFPALVAALLFAVHPLHVEAVTYVAGRSDPLAAAFLLLAMLAFLRRGRGAVAVSVAAYFLALLAREAAVVLPLLLVLVDRMPPGRARRPPRAYLPYALVLAAYLVLRAFAVAGPGATPATAAVPLARRMLTTASVVLEYLRLWLLPAGLHLERTVAPVAALTEPRAVAGVATMAALAAVILARRRRAWPIALGLAWFLVALLPVANLVPLATFMAEHWLYVPTMGLSLAAGWSVATAAADGRRQRAAVAAAAAIVIAVYGAATARRNRDWRDARTLYESLVPLAPESVRVRVDLAHAYQEAGDVERARASYEETIRRWPDAPETADAWNNLGNIERDAGRLDAALAAYEHALTANPRHVSALNGRALALQRLGRSEDAERALLKAVAIAPESAVTHSNLGNVYFRRDELARARDEYVAAVRLDPDYADAHNNLGSAYFRLGQSDLAAEEYRRALQLNPRLEDARRNLAVVDQARAR